ncbi:YL1 nuclear protein-domain-containing protein [Cercophora newfieldiana]|uniref:YL1 nuclear protein-domain-containing protein n=1 Tax=Cercophora newfieldiana TaxID=92897 RepID=A0AA39Y5H4_9PEZI|nr:YL1 nuclear protein-domain-containing protein [Cercophora newfieldiana]
MATAEENTPKPSELSDLDSTTSSDDDGDSDSGEPAQVEWLATTRAKRSTAGNRMKSMLANEEPAVEDSDLELLFAEDEDDAGFSDDAKEDPSDVQMDSSSDDEDQDENADDLEGEKELERQAREKKTAQRKRKAQEAIPAKFRKKVRIEQPRSAADSASPRSTAPPPPRPKKKSERMSWIPSAADAPTRASDRSTTRISKQQLHQKMVEDEVRRKKQMERMEKNAKRLEALKKPPMTQAERLAEAAIVEKRNSKSLNRWEVAEKQREEERLRKIAALNSRKLDGPVVTFWSGIQALEEGQQKHVGNLVSIEEKAPRKKRQSAAAALAAKEQGSTKSDNASNPVSPVEPPGANTGEATPVGIKTEVTEPPAPAATLPAVDKPSPEVIPHQDTPPAKPVPEEHSALPAPVQQPILTPPLQGQTPPAQTPASAIQAPTGPTQPLMVPPPVPPPPETTQPPPPVLAAPVLAPPVGVPVPMLGSRGPMLGFSKSNCLAPPNTSSHTPSPLSLPPTMPSSVDLTAPAQGPLAPTQRPAASTSVSLTTFTPPPLPPPLPVVALLQPTQGKATPPSKEPETPKEAPPEPPREGKVTRSCIILQNFDENAIKDRQVQTQILFGRKMNKLAKPGHAPLCVITNHPAKYRDPKTGLPFYSSAAYKEIQKAYHGDYKYSRVLGAYVGTDNVAARGVPDRFLDPTKERSTPKTLPKQPEATPAPKENVAGVPAQAQNQQPTTGVAEPRLVPIVNPVTEARLVPVDLVGTQGEVAMPPPPPPPPPPPTHHTTM